MFRTLKPVYQIGMDDYGGGSRHVGRSDIVANLPRRTNTGEASVIIQRRNDAAGDYWTYSGAMLYFVYMAGEAIPLIELDTQQDVQIGDIVVTLRNTPSGFEVRELRSTSHSGKLEQLVLPLSNLLMKYLQVTTRTTLAHFVKR
jgi:hypothetical protein